METLTIAEAAETTGLTKKAIRNRVDRGQLRAVLRDGVRHIPRSEIERAGLTPGFIEAGDEASMRQEATPGKPSEASGWNELLGRLERQAGELAELRQLTREAESLHADRGRSELVMIDAWPVRSRRRQSLECARAEQQTARVGERAGERGQGEQRSAGEKHAPAPQEVRAAPPEEQQARECKRVGVDDPLQAGG